MLSDREAVGRLLLEYLLSDRSSMDEVLDMAQWLAHHFGGELMQRIVADTAERGYDLLKEAIQKALEDD